MSSIMHWQSIDNISYNWMKLDACLDFISKAFEVDNPMNGHMPRTFSYLFNNPTKELLAAILSDYSDLLKSTISFIELGRNKRIEDNSISKFGNQANYKRHIFIAYDKEKQLYIPWTFSDNNVPKICLDDNEAGHVNEFINDRIVMWNDKINALDRCLSISQMIQIRLQRLSELIPLVENRPNNITLDNVFTDFNDISHLNQSEISNGIRNDLSIISDCLQRMVSSPDHEEDTEPVSTPDMEVDRNNDETSDTMPIVNRSIICEQQSTFMKSNSVEIQYISSPPAILIQPTQYQRVRMFSDLQKGCCPLVQAGGKDAAQQTYIQIQVPPDRNDIPLYIAVRAVTVKRLKHPKKSVLPKNVSCHRQTSVSVGERLQFDYDKNDFDPVEEFTYLLITPEECTTGTKEIPIYLIKWKDVGTVNRNEDAAERHNLCKLEFYFCIRIDEGKYKKISRPSYSSIIEGADGPLTIPRDAIQENTLRDIGEHTIELPLSAKCLKRDLHIFCNEELLSATCFKIDQKQLIINIPARTENTQALHLKILRKEYNDRIEDDENIIIYEHIFTYVSQP